MSQRDDQADSASRGTPPVATFDARAVPHNGELRVAVSGEIDIATSSHLWTEIDGALGTCRRVVMDLSETTLIDSTGLTVLVRAYQRLGEDPQAIVVRGAHPSIRKVLLIAGFDQILTIDGAS